MASWHYGLIRILLFDFILVELRPALRNLFHRYGLLALEINVLIEFLSTQGDAITSEAGDDKNLLALTVHLNL